MSADYASDDDVDDYHGDYTLEEYDIGPSVQQEEQKDAGSIDFRMDAPPPQTSMENRLRDASQAAPEGMQLARPSPECCAGGGPATTQTGPKAVKADYEAAKQVLRNKRLMENMRKERQITASVRVDLQALQMSPEEQARAKKAQQGKGVSADRSGARVLRCPSAVGWCSSFIDAL